ncbi:MAG: M13 family metallopeptidase [Candidatus Accumulibacter propinquus]|jgi:putative endopeptidase|uniref:M13 family metallopeptidase n=1 Tax=Candidatus Accumulibacter propinquus TaxID=2954380 RepID=UPI002FC302DA
MKCHNTIVVALATAFAAAAVSAQEAPTFGYPVGFSVSKMDTSVSPRKDFTRYAAGKWYDAMEIPADQKGVSGLSLMSKRTDVLLGQLVEEATRKAASAPKGSPTQQVGDLYAAGMDEARLKALGNAPLQPVFQRIRAISDKQQLPSEIARLQLATNDTIMLGGAVTPGIRDKSKYIFVVSDSSLLLSNFEDYYKPEAARYREAYLKNVTDTLVLAGFNISESRAFADKALAIETRIAKVRQPLLDQNEPDKRYLLMRYEELKALTPAFDWDAYFATIGLTPPTEVTAVETKAMAERSAILSELSLDDLKMLLMWEYLRRVTGGLSPDFNEPKLALSRTYFGDSFALPTRSKQVLDTIAGTIGHPMARLFVEKNFSAESKRAVEDMVGRVHAEFRSRLAKNTWLTKATRQQALYKLDKVKISVGYPEKWIDYSAVDIRPGEYFGDLERISEFLAQRNLARWGGPVAEDEFANPSETLPTLINAGYDPLRNAIEIPAAFLQPPIYDPKGDPATNFCAIGAVIGHEITHGFDSGGRHYDEIGRARNWWVKTDEVKFNKETQKLVRQSSNYQVLPGLQANGELTVTENLADVGGIAFAYGALTKYLKAHPEEDTSIDGLSQAQRCFIAWGQVWSDKIREGFLRQITATNPHAAGQYRAYAAAQHEPGFYAAFGIRPGDPMWLAPKDRARIW